MFPFVPVLFVSCFSAFKIMHLVFRVAPSCGPLYFHFLNEAHLACVLRKDLVTLMPTNDE